ncbi:nucleotidyltransferase family protein [Solimicrobium silvestre]|uniref:Putative MobA-related protein n=1 Tax=Solimicrobium silvestre TaxID=2099400 RepID=A0A2S9H1W0_9BURK|nr:nucleotidyltransferase family protein [Solimicrobium silvestre]PRC93947.1 putative MobA-related protein [Solimicrobium silvestre]
MSQQNTVGILLAAGGGLRFDPTGVQNKLTQILPSGTPVAVQAAGNLLAVLTKVIAVVRCATLAQQLTEAGCEVHLFSQAEQGMGASLAYVIHHAAGANVDSVLVALADMPYLQTETIRKMLAALAAGTDIVQPYYQQQAGHPVGFSKRHFPALMSLTGDIGARHLLREFSVLQLPVDDAGVVRDIDFLSDLQGK